MGLLRDLPTSSPAQEPAAFAELVDENVALHLGISGQEFRWGWYGGLYEADPRPVVRALNELMRTGVWRPPQGC